MFTSDEIMIYMVIWWKAIFAQFGKPANHCMGDKTLYYLVPCKSDFVRICKDVLLFPAERKDAILW